MNLPAKPFRFSQSPNKIKVRSHIFLLNFHERKKKIHMYTIKLFHEKQNSLANRNRIYDIKKKTSTE